MLPGGQTVKFSDHPRFIERWICAYLYEPERKEQAMTGKSMHKGTITQSITKQAAPLWRRVLTMGLFVRLLFALLVSWLIVMAFFATSALSN
jgi:hypothetical protein